MESSTMERKIMDISQFIHTPYYCEEHVFFLCKKLCESGISNAEGSDLFVVFISNDKKQVHNKIIIIGDHTQLLIVIPLWHQKASNRADGVVLWDYHVICIQKRRNADSPHLVWDLDSTLPFPSPLTSYISETIRPSFQLFSQYQRLFRIVHAPVFLHHFASDRRHMKDSAGNWIAEPPPYEPIIAQDGAVHNLNEYMEIHASNAPTDVGADMINSVFTQKLGVVVRVSQLEEFFSQIP